MRNIFSERELSSTDSLKGMEQCHKCFEKFLRISVDLQNSINIPKFTLQVYAFVYQRLMDFPQRRFDYETLTTKELFDSVHKIINKKTHLHHSHTSGKIIGYAHDFCNAKVRENKDVLTCIAQFFWL